MKTDIRYLAALRGLGTLDARAMRLAVDNLMNAGFYAEECLDALDSKPPRVDEVLPAFLAALAHYGVAVPDRELAVWQLIKHHLKRVVSPSSDPWECLRDLVRDLYWEYDFHSKSTQYLGDSHGLHRLIGIYWEIDDLAGESGKPIDAFRPDARALLAIQAAAEQWIQQYSGKHAA
jgi:hypothetical protein